MMAPLVDAASVASGDFNITKVSTSCAPALSKNEKQLYLAVNSFDFSFGYLLELDSTTLQPINKVRLIDPASGNDALITDQSSASPTVGPDGDVFYGVLKSPFPSHNDRGWLLPFSGNLRLEKIPRAASVGMTRHRSSMHRWSRPTTGRRAIS